MKNYTNDRRISRFVLLTGVLLLLLLSHMGTAEAGPTVPLDSSDIVIRSGWTYTISNADELYHFAQITNTQRTSCEGAVIELMDDIVVNEGVFSHDNSVEPFKQYNPLYNGAEIPLYGHGLRTWTSISSNTAFKGTFEGNGHSISGLYRDAGAASDIALFGSCDGGTIRNVTLKNSYFRNGSCASICGLTRGAKIVNCHSSAILVGTRGVGGLVVEAAARGGDHAYPTVLQGCSFSGEVLGGAGPGYSASDYSFDQIGGLASMGVSVQLKDCIFSGTAEGDKLVGAFVGYNHGESIVVLENCICTGISTNGEGQHLELGEGTAHVHTFGDPVTVTEPTEEKTGSAVQTCTECGYGKETVIPKLEKLTYTLDITNGSCGYIDEGNYGELLIYANEGCHVDRILVNDIETSAEKILKYKDGDRIQVFFAKDGQTWEETASEIRTSKTIAGVKNTKIKAATTKLSSGKIRISWTKSAGYSVDYFEVFRSTVRSKVTGGKAFYKTSSGSARAYTNSKSLKKGTRYYYKVRGVRIISGKKYYTNWSNLVYRTV